MDTRIELVTELYSKTNKPIGRYFIPYCFPGIRIDKNIVNTISHLIKKQTFQPRYCDLYSSR